MSRQNFNPTSGNLNGAAGTTFAGATVQPDCSRGGAQQRPRPNSLSAQVAVTAATASLAVYLKWQVSTDNTNWSDVATSPQNAAPVALVTGTAAATTKIVGAPESVYAFPYARAVAYSGGASGSTSDLVTIGYNWQSPIAVY